MSVCDHGYAGGQCLDCRAIEARSQSERVSRLEEALKPFAEAFDEISDGKGVWVERPINEPGYLNIKHFRAARDALNQGADDGR